MRKKIGIILIFLIGLIFLISNQALAGSCLCSLDGQPLAKRDCFTNVALMDDCNKIKTDAGTKYAACILYPSHDRCSFSETYKGVNYLASKYSTDTPYPADKTCKIDSDCASLVKTGTQLVGKFACKLNKCYVDAAGRDFIAVGTVSFLGIERQLRADIVPTLQIRIPFYNPDENIASTTDSATGDVYLYIPWLAQYLSAIYKFAMVAASIVAVAMLIQNGIKIVISGGGELKTEAYKRIAQIVIGLFLVWGSYTILYAINPALVEFKVLKVKYIEGFPIPEDEDAIEEGEYPDYVVKPAWHLDFDCEKGLKNQITPAGVIPIYQTETYTCPGIDGKITTIKEMKEPLCKVGAKAVEKGYTLKISQGGSYRNFAEQVHGWCVEGAKLNKDVVLRKKYRAPPGYSNHGHGRAVDMFLVKDNKQLFNSKVKKQCFTDLKLVKDIAEIFYAADSNFNRLEREIWHFEYGTGNQQFREQYLGLPEACGKGSQTTPSNVTLLLPDVARL